MTTDEWRAAVSRQLDQMQADTRTMSAQIARLETRMSVMETRESTMSEQMKALQGTMLWSVRGAMLVFIGAVVNFVIDGGLIP